MERAFIYGDSLLKATVPDEDMHYRFHLPEVMAQYPTDRLEVVNRAKMGATVTKGLSLVEHDVQRGMDARWALVAYGGNDSVRVCIPVDDTPEAVRDTPVTNIVGIISFEISRYLSDSNLKGFIIKVNDRLAGDTFVRYDIDK